MKKNRLWSAIVALLIVLIASWLILPAGNTRTGHHQAKRPAGTSSTTKPAAGQATGGPSQSAPASKPPARPAAGPPPSSGNLASTGPTSTVALFVIASLLGGGFYEFRLRRKLQAGDN